MKKQEIKKKVEVAKSAYMPKAIKEEAEYRARDEVRKALYEEPEFDKPAPQPEPRAERTAGSTVIAANDPRLSGGLR